MKGKERKKNRTKRKTPPSSSYSSFWASSQLTVDRPADCQPTSANVSAVAQTILASIVFLVKKQTNPQILEGRQSPVAQTPIQQLNVALAASRTTASQSSPLFLFKFVCKINFIKWDGADEWCDDTFRTSHANKSQIKEFIGWRCCWPLPLLGRGGRRRSQAAA